MAHPLLAQLNPEQRAAVETTEGAVLVLAGAGSGKTRVLTHRVAYLIEACGIPPESILAVTFTNKAAQEMRNRVLELLQNGRLADGALEGDTPAPSTLPTMGTFHAICAQILRRDIHHLDRARNFVVFDTVDQAALVRKLLKEVAPHANFSPRAVLSRISKAKNQLQDPEAYARQAGDYFEEIVAAIYPKYSEGLKQNEALDFDDLLMLTVQLLEQHADVREKYQRRWQYVLIDEYQDTNHVQYRLAQSLVSGHGNLCVVGDDDQSIYAFRGADIGNILAFTKDHPQARTIKLEQNYRSPQPILDAAYSVIHKNRGRTAKKLWTERKTGSKITVYEALNETEEANYVLDEVPELKAAGISLNEMAVLYRTNAQSRAFEEACVLRGIPYRLVGGVKFYERKEIKDLVGFLRLVYNPEEQLSLERIINVPPRGIGNNTLRDFLQFSRDQGGINAGFSQLDLAAGQIHTRGHLALIEFRKMLLQWRETAAHQNVLDLFDRIVEDTGYLSYINDGSPQAEERYENIKELRNTIASYTEYGPQAGLAQFLEEVALMTDLDTTNFEMEAITLITLHAVKGLEYDVVFLTGMEEGLFPHSRSSLDEKELEEERRLCYVGMTRAKQRLFLTHAQTRTLWGETRPTLPSRFLSDLPSSLVDADDWESRYAAATREQGKQRSLSEGAADLRESKKSSQFKEGQRVRHKTFGVGVIVQIKQDELTVSFESGGLKRLLESVAPLEAA